MHLASDRFVRLIIPDNFVKFRGHRFARNSIQIRPMKQFRQFFFAITSDRKYEVSDVISGVID